MTDEHSQQDNTDSNQTSTRKDAILDANRRWLRLMNAQSTIHRETRDPRLYRHSSKEGLIKPRVK